MNCLLIRSLWMCVRVQNDQFHWHGMWLWRRRLRRVPILLALTVKLDSKQRQSQCDCELVRLPCRNSKLNMCDTSHIEKWNTRQTKCRWNLKRRTKHKFYDKKKTKEKMLLQIECVQINWKFYLFCFDVWIVSQIDCRMKFECSIFFSTVPQIRDL